MDVTALTVNFRTPSLISDCVRSFHSFYPNVTHLVIDNGGCEKSLVALRKFARDGLITLITNKRNVGHGPALDMGFRAIQTPYVFTIDSDTRTLKGGFIEQMTSAFEDNDLFAIGWLRYTNDNGVASPRQELKRGRPYVHPYAALWDREKYLTLDPFVHRGAPAIKTMISAVENEYHLQSFPIEKYVWHKIAGTRGMFGGEWNVDTKMRAGRWRMHRI